MTVLVPGGLILDVKRITDAAFSLFVYYRGRFQPLFGSKLVIFKPKYEVSGENVAKRSFSSCPSVRECTPLGTCASEQRLAPARASIISLRARPCGTAPLSPNARHRPVPEGVPMNFHNASFKAAYGTSEQLPPSAGPEVSFAGRSNVGKSSLLNKLMYRKGLAKVSSTPGKTATINFYDVDGHDLVDLPGYGYAKVSKSEKGRWSELIEGYYNQDRAFALVVSLIDIRHEPSALDRNMVRFLQDAELPFAIALTKADKLSKQQQMKQRGIIKKALDLPRGVPMVVTSSEKGDGIDELRTLISQAMER